MIGEEVRTWAAKRGLNTKLHLAVDTHVPVKVIMTAGPRSDCKKASRLIEGIEAGHLLGDKGYDSNSIIEDAESAGMKVVIPPKKNRKEEGD